MPDSPTLGQQLVVMRETALCDRRQHEVHLVTDGATAYAWGDATDVDAVVRESAHRYEATCGQPGPGFRGEEGDPCEGRLEWDTSSDTCWTSDPDTVALLRFGNQLERGDGLGDGE